MLHLAFFWPLLIQKAISTGFGTTLVLLDTAVIRWLSGVITAFS